MTIAQNNDVKIKQFKKIGEDPRGVTAEFSLPRKQSDFIFLTRKKGSLSGNTFHEGKNESTNPKIFILLSGKIIFSYRKIGTTNPISEEISGPAMIEISPYVTHKIEVLEDMLILEGNSIQDIQNDRIKEEV